MFPKVNPFSRVLSAALLFLCLQYDAAAASLTATPGKAQITLSWGAVSGATSYKLYKFIAGLETLLNTASDAGQYVDTPSTTNPLNNNVNYSYSLWVSGTRNGNSFVEVAYASGKVLLPAPVVTGESGKASAILTWPVHENADYYIVYYYSGGSWSQLAGQYAGSCTHTGLTNQNWHSFKVQGINAGGAGYEGSGIAFVYLPAPEGVRTTRDANNDVIVSWGAVGWADRYKVYGSNYSGYSFSQLATVTGTSYNAGQVTSKKYYYVVANNDGGDGYPSVEVNSDIIPGSAARPPHEGACPLDPAGSCTMDAETGGLPISSGDDSGPSYGDPVNLALGTESYAPHFDLAAYNRNGPAAVWQRYFRSNRSKTGYGSPGLSSGWVHNYDATMTPTVSTTAWQSVTLTYPGGPIENVTPVLNNGVPTGAFTTPAGVPYFVQGVPSATATNQWDSITITWRDRTRWCFVPHASGTMVLSSITNQMGKAIALTWDSSRRLMAVTDAVDNVVLLAFTYGNYGLLTTVQDAYGREVDYTVDVVSTAYLKFIVQKSVSLIHAAGASNPGAKATYGYSALGSPNYNRLMLTSITVTSPTGTGTSQATISYNSQLRVSSRTDGNGNTRSYTYNAGGTRVDVKNSSGVTILYWTQNYDSNFLASGTTDSASISDSILYGDAANPAKPTLVTDRNGHQSSATYDSFGNALTITDARGIVTTNTYDYNVCPLGRLTSTQQTGKPATTFTYYEPSGLIETVTSPAPGGGGTVTSTYTYDALGNVLTVTTPGNNAVTSMTTTFNYTTDGAYSQTAKLGQPLTVTDDASRVTHFRYDSQGRVVWAADPLGNEADTTYNVAGQVLTAVAPATGQQGPGRSFVCNVYLYPGGPLSSQAFVNESGVQIRQVVTNFGKEGEILSVSGNTELVTCTYDAAYRLKTLADGAGNTTTYNYNTRGLPSSVVYPGGDTEQYVSYDNDGNVLTAITPNGVTVNYVYDDCESLLTAVQYPSDMTRSIAFTYDEYGRRETMVDPVGVTAYSYGLLDELLSVTTTYTGLPAKTVSYAFYADGSRSEMTTPAGTTTYTYDNVGRLVALSNPYAEVSTWSYHDNDWIATQTLGNGSKTTYGFNAAGRLTSLVNRRSDGTILSQFTGLLYDGIGNLGSVNASVTGAPQLTGATTYLYDNKNQLTQELSSRNGGYTHNYAYDSGGNGTTFKGVARTFNNKNQLTGTGLAYDSDGNPTTYEGASLTFDFDGHLRGYGTVMTADYDGEGRRAWKQNSAGRIYYLYDGMDVVCELDSDGYLVADNSWGANGLLSRRADGASVFYTFDHRGSAVQRLDYVEAVLSSHGQDATGQQYAGSLDSDGYSGLGAQWGYETDAATGLQLLGFRYYDPQIGRFLTRDPAGYNGTTNLYGYCHNSPTMRSDAVGLDDEELWYNVSANHWKSQVSAGKAFMEEHTPWVIAGAANTVLDLVGGVLTTPQTIGQFGQGFGAYAGNPSDPNNQIAFWNDLGTSCSIGLAVLGAYARPVDLPAEGIYVVRTTSGRWYVGQSANIAKRLNEHIRTGKITRAEAKLARRYEVKGGRTAREIAEQRMIDRLGGLKRLENRRNPIGPKRRHLM